MSRLSERMNFAKIVLCELSHQPLRRTELETRALHHGGTPASFEGIFRYLTQDGFVAKTEQKHCSTYTLTEKGAKLLEAIA